MNRSYLVWLCGSGITVQRAPPDDPVALRARVEVLLARSTGQRAQIKESFTQNADSVCLHLRINLDGRWHNLPTVTASRLKPARLQAWQALLGQLESGSLTIQIGIGGSHC